MAQFDISAGSQVIKTVQDLFAARREDNKDKTPQVPIAEPGFLHGPSSFLGSSIGPQDNILRIMDECGLDHDQNTDPRDHLELSRGLGWAFPFINLAVKRRCDLAGNLFVDWGDNTVDKGLEKEIMDIWENWETIRPNAVTHTSRLGMQEAVKNIFAVSAFDGSKFGEYAYDPNNMRDLLGNYTYESTNFIYQDNGSGIIELWSDSAQKYIQPSELFFEFKFSESDRWAWGKPITWGMDFMADSFLRLIIGKKDFNGRIANPAGMTVISVDAKDDSEITSATIEASIKGFKGTVVENQKKRLNAMAKQGKPSHDIYLLPGQIKLEESVYGKGAHGFVDYAAEFDRLATQVILNTCIPPEMIGISQPAGLGDTRLKTLKEFLPSVVDRDCKNMGKWVKDSTNLALLSRKSGRNNDKWKVGWEKHDLEDHKLNAETGKLNAEKIEIMYRNFESILSLSGQEAAKKFAEDNNYPEWWNKGVTPPLPEPSI